MMGKYSEIMESCIYDGIEISENIYKKTGKQLPIESVISLSISLFIQEMMLNKQKYK